MSDYNEIDEHKLEELKYGILNLEDQNAKTKERNNGEMVDEIKRMIQDSVKDKNF